MSAMAPRRKRSRCAKSVHDCAAISRSRTLLPTFGMATPSTAVLARCAVHGAGVLHGRLVGQPEGRIENQFSALMEDIFGEVAHRSVDLVRVAGREQRGRNIAAQR